MFAKDLCMSENFCFVLAGGQSRSAEVYHLPPFMVDIMLAIRIVWLCFWVVDILFTCSTAIYVDGTLVTSRKAIVKASADTVIYKSFTWLSCFIQTFPPAWYKLTSSESIAAFRTFLNATEEAYAKSWLLCCLANVFNNELVPAELPRGAPIHVEPWDGGTTGSVCPVTWAQAT